MNDESRPPRADLRDGVGWMLLGAAVLAGSLAMDRLESQGINPYTVPGLLPGLLGIMMLLLGGILVLRSLRRGALHAPGAEAAADEREQRRRVAVVVVLCVGYGVVLIGHGIPFWLASTLYVTASILIVQRMSREVEMRRLTPKAWAKAIAVGLGASVVTQLVFQELFLVRLP